jgi:hypothetical protein
MTAPLAEPRPAPATGPTATRRAGPHRLPAPQTEPPRDGEPWRPTRSPLPLAAQPTLPLQFAGGRPVPAADLRLVGPAGTPVAAGAPVAADPRADALSDAAAVEAFCQPAPTATAVLPEPRRWTAQLAQAAVEVIAGIRPPQQLLRWVGDDVYERLQARHRGAVRRPGPRPPSFLRSVRVSLPRDGVVEATAVVQCAGRCRAMAIRLEGWDGRWRATELDLV